MRAYRFESIVVRGRFLDSHLLPTKVIKLGRLDKCGLFEMIYLRLSESDSDDENQSYISKRNLKLDMFDAN